MYNLPSLHILEASKKTTDNSSIHYKYLFIITMLYNFGLRVGTLSQNYERKQNKN